MIGLTVFFTAGVGLHDWEANGNLDRELGIYNYLAGRQVKINLVTYGGKKDRRYRERISGLRVLPVSWHRSQKVTAMNLLACYLPALASSRVFKTNQLRGSQIAVWLKTILGKKLIVRCGFLHSFFVRNQTRDENTIREALYWEGKAFRSADMVFVTSSWQKDYVRQEHGIAEEIIRVVPNYVETEKFKPLAGSRPEYDLVFVGRDAGQKNLDNLLAALALLAGDGKRFSLALAGDCAGSDKLRGNADKYGLDVAFLGSLPNSELPALLNKSRCFILPSFYEGHPKVLLEAMSCGLACIGARVPGVREEIEHKQNGYLCSTGPEDIARAIEDVLSDESLRQVIGKNARRHVVENYDINRIGELELAALEEVIKK